MNIYKIYVATKKKDGTVTKSEAMTERGNDPIAATSKAISIAKERYGYKGKVHICSIWQRDDNKKWNEISL